MIGPLIVPDSIKKYKISVVHPGVSLTKKVEQNLYRECVGSDEFFMNVATVVCGDDQCRIDTVAIYWDNLGFYKRLELPLGVELEKAKGLHFSPEDYSKLDDILGNRNASLIDVYKEDVVGTISSDAVDGISGATIILNTNDYVTGAVWTCYTLWHWANGDVYRIIRDLSGAEFDLDDLVARLDLGNDAERIFSIEQLIRRKEYSLTILDTLVRAAPSFNQEYARLVIDYFEAAADSDLYFQAMELLLYKVSKAQRVRFLSSLYTHPLLPQVDYLERLCKTVQGLGSFQEIDLVFGIIDRNKDYTPIGVSHALSLLQSEQFMIARRAYWFLNSHSLSDSQSALLEEFYRRNEDRL